MSDQMTFEYPSGVDPNDLRQYDLPYLNYALPMNANSIHVIKADEMFR
jgi:hypothetical protein